MPYPNYAQEDACVRGALACDPIRAARLIHEGCQTVSDGVWQEVIQALLRIVEDTQRDWPLSDRISAGVLLGYLGDPRFPSTRLDAQTSLILPPMVEIPAGDFYMGTTDEDIGSYEAQLGSDFYKAGTAHEQPAHKVTLAAYALGRYPVTCREYEQFVGDGGHTGRELPPRWRDPRCHKPNCPVMGVSWDDASRYCTWLTAKTQPKWGPFRLPTEAEWEYAVRGTERRLWPWGNEPPPLGDEVGRRCNGNRGSEAVGCTTPVGIYPQGSARVEHEPIFDLAGNVWEWCADFYDRDYYKDSPPCNPLGPSSGTSRVLRGGAWLDSGPNSFRSAHRRGLDPSDRNVAGRGFRVCRTLPP
jgi:iron(II)-dependent oxidoreductase